MARYSTICNSVQIDSSNWIPSFTINLLLPEYYPDGHLLNGILSVNTWKGGNAAIRNTIWILAMMKGKEKLSANQKRGCSIGCWCWGFWKRILPSVECRDIGGSKTFMWFMYCVVRYIAFVALFNSYLLKRYFEIPQPKDFPRRWKVKTKIFSTMSCNVEGTSFKLLEKGLSTYFFSHLELIKSFPLLANCMKVLNC